MWLLMPHGGGECHLQIKMLTLFLKSTDNSSIVLKFHQSWNCQFKSGDNSERSLRFLSALSRKDKDIVK